MSEETQEYNPTNISLLNILATAVLMNDNLLEVPVDVAVSDFSSKQIALAYDEDRRMLILQLVDMEINTDESGPVGEDTTSDSD